MEERPVPYTPLNEEELNELRYAKTLLENPGFTARMATFLGAPLERGIKMLPPDWNKSLHNSVRGALFKALSVFALRELDLTKIESRPIRGRPWEYLFYVDIPVGRQDLRCARALVHLAEFARTLRTLGSYQSWRVREAATRPEAV